LAGLPTGQTAVQAVCVFGDNILLGAEIGFLGIVIGWVGGVVAVLKGIFVGVSFVGSFVWGVTIIVGGFVGGMFLCSELVSI
jgi:hypothetical protein